MSWFDRLRPSRRDPGCGLILLYHRVDAPARDPQALAVSPANFESHLKVIADIATPLPLAEMTRRALQGKSLPRRAIAITFDDGYRDNIENAEPLLAAAGQQATIFTVTGHCASGRGYWWDVADEAILGRLPAGRHAMALPDGAAVLEVEGAPLGRDEWTALHGPPSDPRRSAYADLMLRLKPLAPSVMSGAMASLRDLAGMGPAADIGRPATPDEIAASAGRGVLTFEAHTVNHPQLALLNEAEQRAEISGCADQLTEWIGRRPTLFAYPYGTSVDYDAWTIEIVQQSGYYAAFANVPGLVRGPPPRWEIPRVLVRDWDEATFRAKVEHAFASLAAPA